MEHAISAPRKLLCVLLAAVLAIGLCPIAPASAHADPAPGEAGIQPLSAEEAAALDALDDEATDGILIMMEEPDAGIMLLGEDAQAAKTAAIEEEVFEAGLTMVSEETLAEDEVMVVAEAAEDMSLSEALNAAASIEGATHVQPNFVYTLIEDEEAPAPAEAPIDILASVDDPYAGTPVANVVDNRVTSYQNNSYWLYNSGHVQRERDGKLVDTNLTYQGANLLSAWDRISHRSNVVVAVFDSGCDMTHPDLEDNILTEYAWDAYNFNRSYSQGGANYGKIRDYSMPWPLVTETNPTGDCNGHGTNIAGIIGAVANNGQGMAGATGNRAQVLPIKVTNDAATSSSSATFVSAYYRLFWLINNRQINIKAVNISLGTYVESNFSGTAWKENINGVYTDVTFRSTIKRARDQYNIITVCAGGNGNSQNLPNTAKLVPADWDECISVTALSMDGTNTQYSDYNEYKDISAPGTRIMVTEQDGGYAMKGGTSYASPIVAAACALMFAYRPGATAAEVTDSLLNSARALNKNSANYHYGSGSKGRLDVVCALTDMNRSFNDVRANKYYFDAVESMKAKGIMNGTNGNFLPLNTAVRRQMAIILYNYMGNGEIAPACNLDDVSQSASSAKAINWAVNEGIMTSTGNNRFTTEGQLTRAQVATILYRIAEPDRPAQDTATAEDKADWSNVPNFAKQGVAWAVNHGIMGNGTPNINPMGSITRADLATMLNRAIEADLL